MFKYLSDLLRNPELNIKNLSDEERVEGCQKIIQRQSLCKEIFKNCNLKMLQMENLYNQSKYGLRIELGSGVWPIRNECPEVIASDNIKTKDSDRIDLILDAENMDLEANTVKTIFAKHVFHHLGNPRKFFKESSRVLKNGGTIILIEPFYSFLSKIVFRYISSDEVFDMTQKEWENLQIKSCYIGANQALSYIVFKRDYHKFVKEFPNLEIVFQGPLNNYLSYLLSGGLVFRQLVPNFCLPVLKLIEMMSVPFLKILGIHHMIVIRKR